MVSSLRGARPCCSTIVPPIAPRSPRAPRWPIASATSAAAARAGRCRTPVRPPANCRRNWPSCSPRELRRGCCAALRGSPQRWAFPAKMPCSASAFRTHAMPACSPDTSERLTYTARWRWSARGWTWSPRRRWAGLASRPMAGPPATSSHPVAPRFACSSISIASPTSAPTASPSRPGAGSRRSCAATTRRTSARVPRRDWPDGMERCRRAGAPP